jgi:uncharacterized protein (TIGR00255 family)
MNDEFRQYESAFREAIMQQVKRGKVECRLSYGKGERNVSSLRLNRALFEELMKLQTEVQDLDGNAINMRVSEILAWPGMIQEAVPDQDLLRVQVNSVLAATVKAFTQEREREGQALSEALLAKVSEMQAIVARIEPLLPQVLEQFKQKSIERMQEALGIAIEGAVPQTMTQQEAAERIRQEVTLYGMRIDVAEELARLKIHLDEIHEIFSKGGLVGKRLDFMLQELNREANTLGSKAAIKELSDASIDLKLLIEQIREQVQNLE